MSAAQPRHPSQKSFSKPPKPLRPLGLLLIAVLAVVLPLVPADTNSLRWHGLKTLVFEVTAAVLLALWPMSRLPQSADRHLWKGTALVMGVLVLWAWLSHALSPMPVQAFSLHGFWLLASGFIVMGVVASGTQERDGLTILLDGLNAAAIVIGGAAIALYQQDGLPVAEGTFHDHGLLGAALMTLLPMTLASLVSPVSQGRKLLALLAVIVCAAAMLLAQTRSSWIGAIVALLSFGAMFLFCRKSAPRQPLKSGERQRRRFQAIVYSLLAVCALGFFVASSHQSGLLSQRARTLTTTVLQGHEESVEWRLSTWRGTVKMIEAKPWIGWGAGCYPLHHAEYTGAGQPQSLVRSSGPRIQDEAHNSYLQIAAELGVPGLILWLGVLGVAFAGGARALPCLPSGGLRQRSLIGALASVAGVCVDAFANPAWQFGEVSVYLWIVLGLICGRVAETAGGVEKNEARVSENHWVPQPVWLRPFQIVVAVLVSIWAIVKVIANAHALPVPRL